MNTIHYNGQEILWSGGFGDITLHTPASDEMGVMIMINVRLLNESVRN